MHGPMGTGSRRASERLHGPGMWTGTERPNKERLAGSKALALPHSGQVRCVIQGPVLSSTRTAGPEPWSCVQSSHNRLRRKREPSQHETMENMQENKILELVRPACNSSPLPVTSHRSSALKKHLALWERLRTQAHGS